MVAIRVVFRSIFASGATAGDHVLFTPAAGAPAALVRRRPARRPGLARRPRSSAAFDGLRLGTLLCCIGAANTLANPKRALRVLPGALYELGVAVVVALSVAPQLVESVQRVRRARRLRGGAARGCAACGRSPSRCSRTRSTARCGSPPRWTRAATAAPARATRRSRRLTAALLLLGMLGLCVGAYGLLDGTAPRLLGLPTLALGALLCCRGLALGGRRVRRTGYRPDPWLRPEWVVAGCGVCCAALLIVSLGYDAADLNPSL